jgi:hypothetical protein
VTIHLPNWPIQRLLKEACAEWNLRHADGLLDWQTAPWPRVVVALFGFLRHRFADYDLQVKARPELRLALRAQIKCAALRAYPWLGKSDDPRATISTEPESQPGAFREYMKDLERVRTIRDRELAASRDPALSPAQRAFLRKRVAQCEATLRRGWEFQRLDYEGLIALRVEANGDGNSTPPEYYFDGRLLSPNLVRTLEFSCPHCGARVQVTKRPVQLIPGRAVTIAACFCANLMADPRPGYRLKPDLKLWETLLQAIGRLPKTKEAE